MSYGVCTSYNNYQINQATKAAGQFAKYQEKQ